MPAVAGRECRARASSFNTTRYEWQSGHSSMKWLMVSGPADGPRAVFVWGKAQAVEVSGE